MDPAVLIVIVLVIAVAVFRRVVIKLLAIGVMFLIVLGLSELLRILH
jgi:hypothetical protein